MSWRGSSGIAALLVGLLAAVVAGVADEARPTPPPTAAEIDAWIGQLGSPQFARREAAARSLVGAGRTAIGPLATAIVAEDLEVASRGVEILRAMLAADDGEVTREVERRLEGVASGGTAVASLADSVLAFHHAGLAAAARERLEGQGAVFRERLVAAGDRGTDVEFDGGWRGGPADWQLLSRLRGVARVSVHGVPLDAEMVAVLGRLPGVRRIDLFGTAAPEAAVAALVARIPDAVVDVRKGGKLGVSSIVQAGPCQLSAVEPGSAADKAGLRAGDVIVGLDGEPVSSFEVLTKRLAQSGAGEVARLDVQRDRAEGEAERFTCTVRLDAW